MYDLQHQTEINTYLLDCQNLANFVQQEAEKRFNPVGIRDRLLARRTQVQVSMVSFLVDENLDNQNV